MRDVILRIDVTKVKLTPDEAERDADRQHAVSAFSGAYAAQARMAFPGHDTAVNGYVEGATELAMTLHRAIREMTPEGAPPEVTRSALLAAVAYLQSRL